MKKKNIILAILFTILVVALIVEAIPAERQSKSEKNLNTVITSFLNLDFVWDESREKLCYPEYIDVSHTDDTFCVILPLYKDEEYYMFYFSDHKPAFFVETPKSTKDSSKEVSANIFSVCKRLQYETCFLKTAESTVLIETLRIYRDGTLYAEDSSGKWHKKVSCSDFILA